MSSLSVAGDPPPRKALQAIRTSLNSNDELSWRDSLLPSAPGHRRLVALALALGLAQQLTGTEAILYYAPQIFKGLTLSAQFGANLGVGFAKLTGELVSAGLVDKYGRRLMVIGGNVLITLSIIGIALSFQYAASYQVSILFLCLIMFTFSLGPGPFTLVVLNEMLPTKMRGKVVSTAILFNRLGSGTVALTFLTFQESLAPEPTGNQTHERVGQIGSARTFFVYALLGALITVFYYLFLPDSTGESLEDTASAPKTLLVGAEEDDFESPGQALVDSARKSPLRST